MNTELAILVFARAPVAGAAKTRLIPQLGAAGAAALHSELLLHTLATARAAAPARMELWCAPDVLHPALREAAQRHDATLHAQQGAGLGARMSHAFADALQRSHMALCICTDCPALTATHLRQAAAVLESGRDAVLVPVEDGGYALIGLRHCEPRLFADIAWSSAEVMAQTRAQLRACAMTWQELDTLWDVDRPEDYRRLQQSGLMNELSPPV